MKLHLPTFLFAAVLSTMVYATGADFTNADGAQRTLTETSPGSGIYDSVVVVGDSVNADKVGALGHMGNENHTDYRPINDVTITMTGGIVTDVLSSGVFRGNPVEGDVKMIITGGQVTNLYGGNHVDASLMEHYTPAAIDSIDITIGGDAVVGSVCVGGGRHSGLPEPYSPENTKDFVEKYMTVNGDATLTVKDNATIDTVYGVSSSSGKVTGNVNINILGGTIGHIHAIGGKEEDDEPMGRHSIVGGDVTITISGGKVTGTIYGNHTDYNYANSVKLVVGSEDKPYNGTVGELIGIDSIIIAKNSSLTQTAGSIFSAREIQFCVSADNLTTPCITGTSAAVEHPITLNITAEGKLGSGKYMLADVTTNSRAATTSAEPEGWNAENVTVNGIADFDDLTWEGSVLYLIYQGVNVDAAIVSNWGVFKSSQAFTGTLWGNRSNAVVLDAPAPVTISDDGKSSVSVADAPAPGAKNLAWGTVYGQSGRISGAGADYSLYGAAIGAERQFGATGSSIGVAFGYDWGKVNPFTTTSADQETWHAALYGRVGAWKAGKGIVSVDWSVAYGDTTSEHDDIAGDWSQDSWQLDLRATYAQALSERATASVFAGVQYYTHDDATVDNMHISSLQNLRLTAGAGLSYAATARTNVYGQASVYFDAMRHNPHVDTNGACFKGTNPGRIGGVFSVGADYAITDRWTLRGAYSFDVAKDSTEHNVNAGVQYSF